MVEIKVRTVNENDMKEISEIYKYYVKNEVCTFEEEIPTEEEMNDRRKSIQEKNYPYIVATTTVKSTSTNDGASSANDCGDNENEMKEIVIGYAYASSFRPRVAYRFTVEDSIYIDINFQKHGVGSILLKELIKQCKELGFKQMIAVIGGAENVGSIKLHQKFGFGNLVVLKDVGFKFDRFIDTISLQLAL